MKHYFLKAVPESKEALVCSCGFIRCESPEGNIVWAEPPVFGGPIKDLPRDDIEDWLLHEGVAFQIFVARMWGAGME